MYVGTCFFCEIWFLFISETNTYLPHIVSSVSDTLKLPFSDFFVPLDIFFGYGLNIFKFSIIHSRSPIHKKFVKRIIDDVFQYSFQIPDIRVV